MKTIILNVSFDGITMDGAVDRALSFLRGDKPRTVFTPNPEMIMEARKNPDFMNVLNNADMVVPDGIGVVYASKFNEIKISERVAGYDLLQNIFGRIKDDGTRVYFFGGAPGVAEEAKRRMEIKHSGLKIVGTADGYFDEKTEQMIIADIINKKPDILLVGLGFPKQEFWIGRHKNDLPPRLLIGVGGSFDGMSGRVKRAPDIFCRLGLEWFYRLMKEPKRFRRQLKLPLFMLIVIKEKIFNGRIKKE